MTAVPIEIQPAPPARPDSTQLPASDKIEIVPDLDEFAEHVKCSCNASDDNPY
jgi:hypothetical protein